MTEIIHQPDQQRFYIPTPEGEAVLAYRLFEHASHSAIDFTSPYVPPPLRGQRLAEKLVYTGLRWAREQNLELHASCWYVARFLRGN